MTVSRASIATKLTYNHIKSSIVRESSLFIPPFKRSDDKYNKKRYGKTNYRHRNTGATVTQLGSMRRVTLLKSQLSTNELHGLARQIDVLGRNQSLSSIVITNHVFVEESMLANDASVLYSEETNAINRKIVASGYEHNSLLHMSSLQRQKLFLGLRSLASAINGNVLKEVPTDCNIKQESISLAATLQRISSRYANPPSPHSYIPTITIPDGNIYDGGYALLMSTYILATSSSTFQIQNPSKGLAFDPIGLSYILPRLGQEHNQPSSQYPVGKVLALSGYQANGHDMVETGIATHYIDNVTKLNLLEKCFQGMPSWNHHQLLVPSSKTLYGQPRPVRSNNYLYRNVSNLLYSSCIYDAAGQEVDPNDTDFQFGLHDDPSIHFGEHYTCYYGQRSSNLLDIAATFSSIWKEHNVEDIITKLRHVERTEWKERYVMLVAKSLADQMEAYCPLALLAVNKLLSLGERPGETLETCIEREMKVQLRLMQGIDYQNWCRTKNSERKWKHSSLKDVKRDEIDELFD